MHLIRRNDIPENQVTDYALYLKRREFIKTSAGLGLLAASGVGSLSALAKATAFNTTEEKTPLDKITTYCNFYEFGTDKTDPAKHAHMMSVSPWDVEIVGECEKPGTYAIEDLLKKVKIEERIYRFRCVEGWSMVIPWSGFPLHQLVKAMQPTSKAKYVQFDTLFDPDSMPGQRGNALEWPYVEGLRMDEAMHPLTLMATGLYGKDLPNQNGAPMRLVVPWKYGFKSIKSIVRITFTETQPTSSWQRANAQEYGFYSNVNPNVPHPRWSQARERRVGEFFKRKTEMFNGYSEQVASLYTGMDLKQFF